ncbi:hypothetical protein [Kineosporia sp. A_224]|uniref:hypothetical protein n=1 Tax=Kineosporia sp. A_224 TaxID=1962180 RepID=UPI0018E9FFFE|nr:hypothetical protein [Kineosporia sp. A_224]
MTARDPQALWESVTGPLLGLPGVTGSTMMGLPCLRRSGVFFPAWDRRTEDLLVKLPASRVDALVDNGEAHAFAPAGRRFREWAAVAPDDAAHRTWTALIEEALDNASLSS